MLNRTAKKTLYCLHTKMSKTTTARQMNGTTLGQLQVWDSYLTAYVLLSLVLPTPLL